MIRFAQQATRFPVRLSVGKLQELKDSADATWLSWVGRVRDHRHLMRKVYTTYNMHEHIKSDIIDDNGEIDN